MPNIWGRGQLFAFSGIDGKTNWFKPLVLHTADEKCCFKIRLPFDCDITISNLNGIEFEILLCDAIAGHTSDE